MKEEYEDVLFLGPKIPFLIRMSQVKRGNISINKIFIERASELKYFGSKNIMDG
jgi:hypothetical protein